MDTDTTWRVEAVCNAPLGEAPYVYTNGLSDVGVGFEVVVAAAPTSGWTDGGALTDFDARQLVRTWAESMRSRRELEPIELHDGLTVARPTDVVELTAERWADRHDDLHLCALEDWLPVRDVRWELVPGSLRRDARPTGSSEERRAASSPMRRLVQVLGLLEEDQLQEADTPAWEFLAAHLTDLAEGDLRPFARMAGLGFMQLDQLVGPMATRGYLQALAAHLGEESLYVEALARARGLADEISDALFPATHRTWDPRFDARRQGLLAVLAGLLSGLAFYSHVRTNVFQKSAATGMYALVGERYASGEVLPHQHDFDAIGRQVARLPTETRVKIVREWTTLRRFDPSHQTLCDWMTARWLGFGMPRMPGPQPHACDFNDLDDYAHGEELNAALSTALLAAVLHRLLSTDEWEMACRPLQAAGITVLQIG